MLFASIDNVIIFKLYGNYIGNSIATNSVTEFIYSELDVRYNKFVQILQGNHTYTGENQ